MNRRPIIPNHWKTIDYAEVIRWLPHRYPFLMVDRAVVNPDPEHFEACAWKGVTSTEPYFQGHFPDRPVMPGVLLIEAIAQTAALAALWHQEKTNTARIMYLISIEHARFRGVVTPGTCLLIHAWLDRRRSRFVWFRGRVWDEQRIVAEARLSSTLADQDR